MRGLQDLQALFSDFDAHALFRVLRFDSLARDFRGFTGLGVLGLLVLGV